MARISSRSSTPDERSRTRRFFNLVAVIYPLIEWNLTPAYRTALEKLDLDPDLNVMDLATGTGILAGRENACGYLYLRHSLLHRNRGS